MKNRLTQSVSFPLFPTPPYPPPTQIVHFLAYQKEPQKTGLNQQMQLKTNHTPTSGKQETRVLIETDL